MDKMPKLANKPHYEGSEATGTNYSHCEKYSYVHRQQLNMRIFCFKTNHLLSI